MEKFKRIKDRENYLISNHGRVFSLNTWSFIGVNRLTKDGYNYVSLSKNNKAKDFRVHRLVATHFMNNPENKETVNHIDGDKTNNHVDNLEWCTREENMQHAYKLGLKKPMKRGNSPVEKISVELAEQIKREYKPRAKGRSSIALGKKYGVHSSTILRIVKA